MKSPRFSMGLALTALVSSLALVGSRPAMAAPLPVGAGWKVFFWSGLNPIYDPAGGFFLDSPDPVEIKITDAYVPGDAFDLYVDGILELSTPTVPTTGVSISDPDVAFGGSDYSWGSLLVGPGMHTIGITLNHLATDCLDGGAFIRADIAPSQARLAPSEAPEPASMALLAAGALPLVRRLRRRRPAPPAAL